MHAYQKQAHETFTGIFFKKNTKINEKLHSIIGFENIFGFYHSKVTSNSNH